MRIGIFGAHRVGKTTLAKRLADALGIEFVPSQTSQAFQRLGIDPSKPMSFEERIAAQQEVLATWEQSVAGKQSFIADRTPLDFVAYVVCETNTAVAIASEEDLILRANGYRTICSLSARDHLDVLIYVQPGIPMVAEEGKGLASKFLVAALDTAIAGLHFGGAFKRKDTKVIVVPKRTIDLEGRVEYCLEHIIGQAVLA